MALRNSIDHLQKQLNENPHTATSAVIFTDSLSALEGLESGDLDENLLQINHKAEKLRSTHLVELKLQWIPGHTDIYGNERADKLAKLGSQKPQPTIPTTPTTLRTAKQLLKQTYKREWMKNWSEGNTARTVHAHMKTTMAKYNMKKKNN